MTHFDGVVGNTVAIHLLGLPFKPWIQPYVGKVDSCLLMPGSMQRWIFTN